MQQMAIEPNAKAEALFEMGLACAAGRMGEIDLVAAHKWFNLAAMQGDERAIEERAEVAAQMTREELAAALREARLWLGATRH
ncbi:MAG: hypothetical protein INF91_08785 [Alphaproteobacteria bacterium]|nr:hypothetical protein [Alphaproteobacteria bacterium]